MMIKLTQKSMVSLRWKTCTKRGCTSPMVTHMKVMVVTLMKATVTVTTVMLIMT